jgi:hypothetical protein
MEVTGAILNIGGMWRFANDDDMTSVVYATDSTIIVNGDFRWGDSAGAVGIFNISGGSLSVALLKMGDDGGGEFNVSGGAEVTIGTEINIDNNVESAEINLDGGTITAQTINLRQAVVNLDAGTISCGTFSFDGGGGVVDINEGMLVIDGNVVADMQAYVNSDNITAYDDTVGSEVVIDYNVVDDKTIVTATTQYTWARFPTPEDLQRNICPDAVTLSWTAGEFADDHDIYLGTDYNEVRDADTSSGVYESTESVTTYNPGTLTVGATYYWRIDGISATVSPYIWKGRIWEFSINDGTAFDPDPAHNETGVDLDPTLGWSAGCFTDTHNVYFGTAFDDVNDATTATSGIFIHNQGGTTYEPNTLDYLGLYYWRIDEVESGGSPVYKGKTWKFRAKSMIIDPNMVLWYEFEEGAGSAIGDSSGYEHHGALVGVSGGAGVSWEPNDGKYGGALRFQSDSSYELSVNSNTLNSVSDGITVAFWINDMASSNVEVQTFNAGSSDEQEIEVMTPDDFGDVYWRAGDDSNDVLVWRSAVPSAWQEDWHHLAFTKNEGSDAMKIYFDGVGVDSKDGVSSSLGGIGGQPIQIGSDHDAAYDDFKIFNRGLSDSEVAALFRGGDVDQAWAPRPFNGETDVIRDVNLHWLPGDSAVEHAVYFGTSFDDVNDADADTTNPVYIDTRGPNLYDPGILQLNTTYYWRIDEVNTADVNSPWRGDVWRFTIANFLIIDDFESYIKSPDNLWYTWDNPHWTGSFVETGVDPFDPVNNGGKSMKYGYDITEYGWAWYAEVERNFASPQDWTDADVKVLTLYFYGHPGNDASSSEQMSIGLEDSDSNSFIDYDGDMNDIKIAEWQEWNIVLSDFTGVDMNEVSTMYIRFGDPYAVTPGGLGTVYMDDIRLYPSRCVPSEGPALDFSGDCIVGFAEIAMMGNQWLRQDQILDTITAPDPCVLHYKFDESFGTTLADSANGYTGIDFNDVNQTPEDIAIRMDPGLSGNSFHFSHSVGDADTIGIKIDPNVWTDNAISQEITVAMWIKNSHTDETPDGGAYMLEFREWNGISVDANERVLAVETTDNGTTYVFHDNSESVEYDLDWENHTEWNHYTFVRNDSNLAIYVNGYLEEIGDSNGTAMEAPSLLYLGLSADRAKNHPEGLHDGFTGNFDYALDEAEAGYLGTDGTGYVPLHAALNIYNLELDGEKTVNFRDYAVLMLSWLDKQYWP